MLWLEMSRDVTHGGGSWGFTRSLWSPTHKLNNDGSMGGKWPFWENLLKVQTGDIVLHLRQDKGTAFVGYSVAEANGFKTKERPPEPGPWAYDDYFYRVSLRNFVPFPTPIDLRAMLVRQDIVLRDYYERNKSKSKGQKKSLFYVVQSGRLQCLNGAYLSEVDNELFDILNFSCREEIVQLISPPCTEAGEIHKLAQVRFSPDVHLTSTIAESRIPYKSEELGIPYRPANEEVAISERDPFAVDPALVERANRSHASTQNALAEYLRNKGIEPRSSRPEEPNFDLAWLQGEAIFVAEIKSLTVDNEEKQLRLGLGQVLRYRHLLAQSGKQVQAVMMLEREPSDQSWISLCEALDVLLVWPDTIAIFL